MSFRTPGSMIREYISPPNSKSIWVYLKSYTGGSGLSKSTQFANERVGILPVIFSTTYASVVNLNDGSMGDRNETFVEFGTTAPLRPTIVAAGGEYVGRSTFRYNFREVKVV